MKTLSLSMLVFLLAGCGAEEPPQGPPVRAVRYERVGAGQGGAQATYSGVARSADQSRLSFRVAGPVSDVAVNVGDVVEEGQLLAELDSSDLNLQLAEAGSAVAQARAQSSQAQAEYQRVRALYEAQGASRSDLDASRAASQTAQTSLRAASSRAGIARNQMAYARLMAPSAGRVSLVSLETGENVSPGQTVVVLESGEQLEVTVAVPENAIGRIEQGAEVEVTFTALENTTLVGRVIEVGVAAESSTYPVTVRLTEEPEGLRPGMAADVRFSLEAEGSGPGIVVPGVAVAADEDGTFVFVVTANEGSAGFGTVHRRAVSVGDLRDDGIEIEDGLEPDEYVVTAGVSRISDGLRVRMPPLAEPQDES